jgi:hypothetical protein
MSMDILKRVVALAILVLIAGAALAAVTLPSASTTEGYVCRLLINEVPFPGEKGYVSKEDTMAAMDQLLYVLDGRLNHVPSPYLQKQVAATQADDIIDVITAGGVKGQFDGFYRDATGKPAMVDRVTQRIDNLVKIAGQGQPGKFAQILSYAADISTQYVDGHPKVPDRFGSVQNVLGIPATGGAFSWMTDEFRFNPGGNYLRIADSQQGALGGNRFFTLRKEPK